jgi:hypothetical protein
MTPTPKQLAYLGFLLARAGWATPDSRSIGSTGKRWGLTMRERGTAIRDLDRATISTWIDRLLAERA